MNTLRLDMYSLTVYTIDMQLEWDESKRRETMVERGIDFAAMAGFDWDTATVERSDRQGETRWAATGYIGDRLHRVVYTERGDRRRIISLRKANARERRDYEHQR